MVVNTAPGIALKALATLPDVLDARIFRPGGRLASLHCDSRRVGVGVGFLAMRGLHTDGHAFVDDALAADAPVLFVSDAAVYRRLTASPPPTLEAVFRVPPGRAPLARLAAAVCGDPARALRLLGVTGTNGKTTTTALTAHLLSAAGIDTVAAGNIGLALSEVAMKTEQPDWVVVEASSYQLADIDRFRPDVGVVTNLAPDHMDRYADMDAYRADKARLFQNATVDSVWVLNGEDPEVMRLAADVPGRILLFRVAQPLPEEVEGAFVDEGGRFVLRVAGNEVPLLHAAELRLLGRHNRANALAAALAASLVAPDGARLAGGLRSFAPPVHRLEPVAEQDGVLWINDSKATNVASTKVALQSMDRPVVLLLGGRHKGGGYAALRGDVRAGVRVVLAFGEARDRIASDLDGAATVEVVPGDLDEVVARARELARPGDVVLLSPACSSFDMFRDYEDRGDRFRALVRGPAGRGGRHG